MNPNYRPQEIPAPCITIHSSTFSAAMSWALNNNESWSDVQFMCKDQVFYAHKVGKSMGNKLIGKGYFALLWM